MGALETERVKEIRSKLSLSLLGTSQDMGKQKAGALETERVKEIRSKMCAEKSMVGRSSGALCVFFI